MAQQHDWYQPVPSVASIERCRNCPAHKGSTLGDQPCKGAK